MVSGSVELCSIYIDFNFGVNHCVVSTECLPRNHIEYMWLTIDFYSSEITQYETVQTFSSFAVMTTTKTKKNELINKLLLRIMEHITNWNKTTSARLTDSMCW